MKLTEKCFTLRIFPPLVRLNQIHTACNTATEESTNNDHDMCVCGYIFWRVLLFSRAADVGFIWQIKIVVCMEARVKQGTPDNSQLNLISRWMGKYRAAETK